MGRSPFRAPFANGGDSEPPQPGEGQPQRARESDHRIHHPTESRQHPVFQGHNSEIMQASPQSRFPPPEREQESHRGSGGLPAVSHDGIAPSVDGELEAWERALDSEAPPHTAERSRTRGYRRSCMEETEVRAGGDASDRRADSRPVVSGSP